MSKCQQNIIQPKLAEKHQFLAENQSPTSLLVLENGANLLIDDDEFELSLLTYLNGFRKRTLPTVFNFGFLTVTITYIFKYIYIRMCVYFYKMFVCIYIYIYTVNINRCRHPK